jgi:hypothetical protein
LLDEIHRAMGRFFCQLQRVIQACASIGHLAPGEVSETGVHAELLEGRTQAPRELLQLGGKSTLSRMCQLIERREESLLISGLKVSRERTDQRAPLSLERMGS